ncbi:MAG: hypothetical protein LUE08_01035 [Akkermansiaceae bacterium]|nr:hypothetical protein [Akkermansiaceae bacterium]
MTDNCFFSLSFVMLHWLFAVSLTLLILDLFLSTEWLSWLSLTIFAAWSALLFASFGLPVQWIMVAFILALAVEFALYYTIWKNAVRPLVMKLFMRGAPQEILDDPVGCVGVLRRGDDGSFCVKVGDLLYRVDPQDCEHFAAGERVKVIALSKGIVRVGREQSAA